MTSAVRLSPDRNRGPYAEHPLGRLIQSKQGAWESTLGGAAVRFYDLGGGMARVGRVNIPYVRDLTHLQMRQAGETEAAIESMRLQQTAKLRRASAFITMTDELAAQIKTELGVDLPHALFRCYPTGCVPTPERKRRREVVYLDNQSIVPVGFEGLLGALGQFAAAGVPATFASRRMAPEADRLRRTSRIRGLSVVDLERWDGRASFGVLINEHGFNQAAVALNRKLLSYLALGLRPVVHESFGAAIRFMRTETPVRPLVYRDIGDAAARLDAHGFGVWDPGWFDMDARVPDLIAALARLASMVTPQAPPRSRARVASPRRRPPQPTLAPMPTPAPDVRPKQDAVEHQGPLLALCLPCSVEAAPLVARTVMALRAQTARDDEFEVIVAVDGPGSLAVADAVKPDSHPFAVQIVDSARPGGDVAHRNHARNAAWRASTAPLCWMLDADMLPEPCAVEHVLALFRASVSTGAPAVLTPCMRSFRMAPAAWLDESAEWFATGDGLDLERLISESPKAADVYSGYADRYEPGDPMVENVPDLPEGMPIIPRVVLEALGGFDERFTGWGGNKEEMVDRLKGLGAVGLVRPQLMRSVCVYHQPHRREQRPMKRGLPTQVLREQRAQDIQRGAPWWASERQRAAVALQAERFGWARQRELIVASMASVPERAECLAAVVESLRGQVDRLGVYLNGYDSVPACLAQPWITVARSQEHGDRGDAGKFFWCEGASGYCLTVDDDIIYPAGYVDRCVRALDERGRGVVVTFHGRRFRTSRPTGYHAGSVVVSHWNGDAAADQDVHVGGTGCMAYHASALHMHRTDFGAPNMADIWVALAAQRQGVPIVALAHSRGWLRPAPGVAGLPTIYDRASLEDVAESDAISRVEWRLRGESDPAVATPRKEPVPTATAGVPALRSQPPGGRPAVHAALVTAAKSKVPKMRRAGVVLLAGVLPSHMPMLQGATFVQITGAAMLAAVRPGSVSAAVLIGALSRLDDVGAEGYIGALVAALAPRATVVIVEPTTSMNRGISLPRVELRPPDWYQTRMRWLNRGQHVSVDGVNHLVMHGRVVRG